MARGTTTKEACGGAHHDTHQVGAFYMGKGGTLGRDRANLWSNTHTHTSTKEVVVEESKAGEGVEEALGDFGGKNRQALALEPDTKEETTKVARAPRGKILLPVSDRRATLSISMRNSARGRT